MPDASPESVQVPVVWVGLDELPVRTVNLVASQFTDDGFFVSFGLATPPLVLGASEEDRLEQLQSIPFVPVQPIARLAMTAGRVRELIAILQENLSKYEEVVQGGGGRTES